MRAESLKVIGITGGVGCGKSRILDYLHREYHMTVIQADLVSHELIEPEGCSYRAILELLGKEILDPEGRIDHRKMADKIFDNEPLRLAVNGIIHPAVKKEIRRRVEDARQQGAAYAVVEAALLLEAHYEDFIDVYWYVYAPEEVRSRRLIKSRGYSPEKIRNVMKSQHTEEEFRSACDAVIDNGGSFERTKEQIRALLKEEEL